tara:strand:+ start:4852 stop:5934 length:1083 start_codon:yes stop_codon:yes gene_type:complete
MKNNQAIPFNKENFKQIWSKEFALVIIVSIPGALIADYFSIPLAWFLGPMLVTSIISLIGFKTKMPRLVLSIILIFLGLYIGSYIDKNLFSQIDQWAWTSFIMLVYIVISVLLVSKYLQKFSGYGKKTSLFSAAPGALGPLLILAESEKSDLSQVATSHLIRLIIIITVFPFFVQSFYGFGSQNLNVNIIENQSILDLLILISLSLILIYLFDKLRVPAALLSGTLVASGFLQITELAAYELPPNIINYCLLILGSSVGCRFANKTFGDIAKNALHSFVATFFLVVLGVIAAIVAGFFIDKNFFTLLLSYCPGGIYEVAVIAIYFNLDPEFVSFHHIIRLLMILFVVPILVRGLKYKKPT